MVRWSGFADLEFPGSAHLAYARAAELAETDAHEEFPDAWTIDDRRLVFSVDVETSRPVLDSLRRFLEVLALQAISGEAMIEVAFPAERWSRRPAAPSFSKELVLGDATLDDEENGPASKTIPVTRDNLSVRRGG